MGSVLTTAVPDEVRTHPEVISAYLGTTKAAV
jgi:ABC-type branched-subunit amino acid transport system ATPase component